MRFCDRCGALLENEAVFCPDCGTRVDSQVRAENNNNQGNGQNNGNNYGNNYGQPIHETPKEYREEEFIRRSADVKPPVEEKKKSGKGLTVLLICIIAVLLVAVIGVACMVFGVNNSSDGGNATPAPTETVTPEPTQEPITLDDVGKEIDDYIDSITNRNNVSFVIYDNNSDEYYYGYDSDARYTAWGFYLPVYFTYTNFDGYSTVTAGGILSNDPAVCNKSANDAIDFCGGLSSVNSHLRSYYDTRSTEYGRKFGDVNAVSDNYTTATEAIEFVKLISDYGKSSLLDYNLHKFSISEPSGSEFHAHIGTENSNVRKNLNVFAVVEGRNSDYCVVVLTKNSTSEYMSNILDKVHTEMEKLYEE